MTPAERERAQEFVDHVAVRLAVQGCLGVPGYNFNGGLYCAIGLLLPDGPSFSSAVARKLKVNKGVVSDVMQAHDLGVNLEGFATDLERICEKHTLRFPGEWF